MPTLIEAPNLRDGYVNVCRRVLNYGRSVAPRGLMTRELRDVIVTVLDPTDALPLGVNRKPNPRIAAAEALQLIGGFSSPGLMHRISPEFDRFTDNGRFHGAYGRRVGTQLFSVVQKLRDDPDTRQAVVTLWEPHLDNQPGFKDYPCTLSLAFTLRDRHLDMHVTMRSNDVWLGLAYDAFQFTQTQLTIARCLDVEAGAYHHHAVSLHLYERDVPGVESLRTPGVDRHEGMPTGFGSSDVRTFTDAFEAARIVGRRRRRKNAEPFRALTVSERWYANVLKDVMPRG